MSPDRTKPTLFSVPQLLKLLQTKYPAACIQENESLEQAHRRGGARDVVDYVFWVCSLSDDELPTIFEPEEEW
jgi:hypothetical protein